MRDSLSCIRLWFTDCESCACLQEVYQQTHPVLFHDRAIYVIVYSLRAEVNLGDLHRHLMNVAIRCKDAPIILVGTHLDAVGGGASLPLRDLKARYPQVRTADLVELPAGPLAHFPLFFSGRSGQTRHLKRPHPVACC